MMCSGRQPVDKESMRLELQLATASALQVPCSQAVFLSDPINQVPRWNLV